MTELIGRDELIAELWDRLGESSVILHGPRRVGKTALLEKMSSQPRTGFRLVRVDLQGATTVADAVARIVEELGKGVVQLAQDVVRRTSVDLQIVKVDRVEADPDPWASLRRTIASAAHDHHLVLALDEVPWWLDELERAEAGGARRALAHLRYLRGDPRFSRVSWALTGSVGLAGRAISWSASAEINDLDIVEVVPLTEVAGVTLFEVETGADSGEAARHAAKEAHRLAGWRPHWIKLLAQRTRASGAPVSLAALAAEAERLLGTPMRHLFQEEGVGHFGRLYTEPQRRAAERVLDQLSQHQGALPRVGLITVAMSESGGALERRAADEVLLRLIDEFYLVEVGQDSLTFAVPLLGLWWAKWGPS